MKLSILVPAYNEGPTIADICEKVRQVPLIEGIEKEVVIVNASSDNTEEAVFAYRDEHPDLPILYLKHEQNMGKGSRPPHRHPGCHG